MRWPDFFVVGAPKAGTTTLDTWLRRLPGIAMAKRNEPLYFAQSLDLSGRLQPPVRTAKAYSEQWSSADPSSLWGEVSPAYLIGPDTPSAIAKVAPEAKIVLALRDPIDRALSHFRYRENRTARAARSFGEAIRIEVNAPVEDYGRSYLLEPGFYGRHLLRWTDCFESVHVLFFDDLVSAPQKVMKELASFLGLTPSDTDLGLTDAERNSATEIRWPWVERVTTSPRLRRALRTLGLAPVAVRMAEGTLLRAAGSARLSVEDRRFLEELYFEDQELLRSIVLSDLPWFDGQWVRTEARRF